MIKGGEGVKKKELLDLLTKQELDGIGATLARGYCSKKNKKKVLDTDLISDMTFELYKAGYHQHEDIDCTKCKRTH